MQRSVKEQLMSKAMKLMQSETGQKIMSSKEFYKAMVFALQTSGKVQLELKKLKSGVANRFELVSKGDFAALQDQVERLQKELEAERKKAATAAGEQ